MPSPWVPRPNPSPRPTWDLMELSLQLQALEWETEGRWPNSPKGLLQTVKKRKDLLRRRLVGPMSHRQLEVPESCHLLTLPPCMPPNCPRARRSPLVQHQIHVGYHLYKALRAMESTRRRRHLALPTTPPSEPQVPL